MSESKPVGTITVRPSEIADMPAVQQIYAHHVLHGLATFEETPPDTEELLRRRAAVQDMDLPYLVAEAEGRIVGYCYAGTYRPRPAYRFTVEDTVYVADGLAGRGIGAALLGDLIARCEKITGRSAASTQPPDARRSAATRRIAAVRKVLSCPAAASACKID